MTRGGEKSEVKVIEADNLTFDAFEAQAQSTGRVVYAVRESNPGGGHYFFGNEEYGDVARAEGWKRAAISVPLSGRREVTVKIGFGEPVPSSR